MEEVLNLRNTQLEMLGIMNQVRNWIHRNISVEPYLAYGALLGAVRHKGFIPWDDDVDLMLFRDAYESLVGKRQQLYEDTGLVLRHYQYDEKYHFPFIRIEKRTYVCDTKNPSIEDDQYIFIEIFPIDRIPLHPSDQHYFFRDISKSRQDYFFKYPPLRTQKSYLEKHAVDINRVRTLDDKYFLTLLDGQCKKYWNSDSDLFGVVEGVNSYCLANLFEEDWNPVELEFEGFKFLAPQGYKELLRRTYGSDYMKIPEGDKNLWSHKLNWRRVHE